MNEKWLVGTYRGWSISRVPLREAQPLPVFATGQDRGFPWLAERGDQWINADTYEQVLEAIDDELAHGK